MKAMSYYSIKIEISFNQKETDTEKISQFTNTEICLIKIE